MRRQHKATSEITCADAATPFDRFEGFVSVLMTVLFGGYRTAAPPDEPMCSDGQTIKHASQPCEISQRYRLGLTKGMLIATLIMQIRCGFSPKGAGHVRPFLTSTSVLSQLCPATSWTLSHVDAGQSHDAARNEKLDLGPRI